MNKQEAIDSAYKKCWEHKKEDEPVVYLSDVLYIINQIDEPQKPVVPQVAVEFYEIYKDENLSLGEWFGDFYSSQAVEEFPRMDELTAWLHDNDNETNRQREFALATLVTFGLDAVEVEKEKLYTVEIPNPNYSASECKTILKRNDENLIELCVFVRPNFKEDKFQFTESEIKKGFEWAWQFAQEVE